MAKLISRSAEIIAKLRAEGKVKTIQLTGEQLKENTEAMEKVKRDYRRKAAKSWESAKSVILNV